MYVGQTQLSVTHACRYDIGPELLKWHRKRSGAINQHFKLGLAVPASLPLIFGNSSYCKSFSENCAADATILKPPVYRPQQIHYAVFKLS